MKISITRPMVSLVMTLTMLMLLSACSGDADKSAESAETQLYTCGMHPEVIQEGPGSCPICKMDLTPIQGSRKSSTDHSTHSEEDQSSFGATITIDPTVEQNMGIRTTEIQRRDLTRTVRTVGRVDYNESEVAHVHTKFNGWIEETHADITGQPVTKGQPLLDIYSPELVSAQEEYLDALRNVSGSGGDRFQSVLSSTRQRLDYFDVSADQVDQLETSRVVRKSMTILSPFSGIVVKKHAVDGMEVKPGMMIYTIADLSEIWVYAEIYEFESPWIEEGQQAVMTLSYSPGERYEGEVQYIYPYLEEKTRTIRVRLSFPNAALELKPGMYANVEIQTTPLRRAVAVPTEAVLFSGERNLVFTALGGGIYAPRDITIGLESGDGYYEVKEGLSEGETIVTSGQFLLDSESRLQEGVAKLLSREER